jgi:hypothetical protein
LERKRKRRAMEMGMEVKEEGSKGACFHGGLYEALASIFLWCSCLLGGERTPSREVFYLSDC